MAAPQPETPLLAALARLVLFLALLPAAVAVALGGDALAAVLLAAIPVGALALHWRGGQLVASGLARSRGRRAVARRRETAFAGSSSR